MPDHLHFIVWLNRDEGNISTLGEIVGAYKSLVKVTWGKYIKATGHHPYQGSFWQSRYQERVLRNEFEVAQKRDYIRNNPLKRALIRGELCP